MARIFQGISHSGTLDALECLRDVFVGVTQGDGSAVGAGGGMLSFSEGVEEPFDFGGFEGLIYFDCGVAGDAGGDTATAGFCVFCLTVAVGDSKDLLEHLLELATFEADWGGFDGESARAE